MILVVNDNILIIHQNLGNTTIKHMLFNATICLVLHGNTDIDFSHF